MSTFVPTKRNLREALLFCFNWKKKAAESHRLLCEVYGEHAPSQQTCEYWFRRFKSGDFDLEDKERPGQPKKFEDEELEALLDEDCCQTQEELAKSLGVTQAAISKRLKAAGFIQKLGNWVPHEFYNMITLGRMLLNRSKHIWKTVDGKFYLTRLIAQTLPRPTTICSGRCRTHSLEYDSLQLRVSKIGSIPSWQPSRRNSFGTVSTNYQKDGKK